MKNNDKIISLVDSGKTYQEVASMFGTTRQNIHLIYRKQNPTKDRAEFGLGKKMSLRQPIVRITNKHTNDLSKRQGIMLSAKKYLAKNKGIPFNLEYKDVIWNTICPVLGVEIDYFASSRQENSPSFDKIDPSKGYIKGNVAIISWRANRIKNDGSSEEHLKIYNYMKENGM